MGGWGAVGGAGRGYLSGRRFPCWLCEGAAYVQPVSPQHLDAKSGGRAMK